MAEDGIGWCVANEKFVTVWDLRLVVELESMGLRPELGSEARTASTC